MQTYDLHPGRLERLAGKIIGHAMATEVLNIAVTNFDMPKNSSKTYVARSWVPYGATAADPNNFYAQTTVSTGGNKSDNFMLKHITQEGVTPAADTIVPRDVPIELKQYMALYAMTDVDYDLYEDDVSEALVEQTGERIGLVRELVNYGKMKGATTKFYAGTSGATVAARSLVTGAIHKNHISAITRYLDRNHAKRITKILPPSVNINTKSVEAAYVAFCHTDLEHDIRELPGVTLVNDYGSRKTISDHEFASFQNVRFVLSADLEPYIDAGVAVGATGLEANSTNVDVYPIIIMAKDAFACLKLRGKKVIDPIYVPVNQRDKIDPGGQRGFIGGKFYMGAEPLNPGWLAVLEVGVTAL